MEEIYIDISEEEPPEKMTLVQMIRNFLSILVDWMDLPKYDPLDVMIPNSKTHLFAAPDFNFPGLCFLNRN